MTVPNVLPTCRPCGRSRRGLHGRYASASPTAWRPTWCWTWPTGWTRSSPCWPAIARRSSSGCPTTGHARRGAGGRHGQAGAGSAAGSRTLRPQADRFRRELIAAFGPQRGAEIEAAEVYEISEYASPLYARADAPTASSASSAESDPRLGVRPPDPLAQRLGQCSNVGHVQFLGPGRFVPRPSRASTSSTAGFVQPLLQRAEHDAAQELAAMEEQGPDECERTPGRGCGPAQGSSSTIWRKAEVTFGRGQKTVGGKVRTDLAPGTGLHPDAQAPIVFGARPGRRSGRPALFGSWRSWSPAAGLRPTGSPARAWRCCKADLPPA